MIRSLSFLVIATFLTGTFAMPNPEEEGYTRLARIAYLEGRVSFQHESDADWSAASINLPLEPGDRIYTGTDGRVEIEFDDGSTFRMAENSDVEILSLRDELIQLRILLGLSTLNVLGDAEFEVDTPAAAFNAVREGIYRFDVVENGATDAIVRKGELEAANNEFSRRLRAGDLLHVSPGEEGNPEISQYDRRDSWDEWNDRRNADLQVYGNQRYLPDDVYMGAADLYRNGRWVNVGTYGNAWVPYNVDPLWSPYSVGRWCYRPFYGWTWVSYEPWGWLPYHYGRWYNSSLYGWCWLPGPSFSFNFWSPALVTFYNGPGWVSWCPLGPGDYYDVRNYHYRRGIYSRQLDDLRRLHTRRPGDLFNRDVRGAFRTVQLERFRDGSFDGKNHNSRWGNIDRPWSQGSLVRERLEIQPSSKSLGGVTDRLPAKPRSGSTLPAIVRNVPVRGAGDRGGGDRQRFTEITNPQIRSAWSGSVRDKGNAGSARDASSRSNARVIQSLPGASSGDSRDSGTGRTNNSRWTGSGAGESGNARSGSVRDSRQTPANPQTPPASQNPSRWRIERAAPEQSNPPQAAPQPQQPRRSTPRSEFRGGGETTNEARQIGRWNPGADSARPAPESGRPAYQPPQAQDTGAWRNSNPGLGRSSERPAPPSYSAPRSEPQGRWGISNGGGRPQESGRTPSYSAPKQSAPSSGRGVGGGQSSGSGSAGRSEPRGNSGHRR